MPYHIGRDTAEIRILWFVSVLMPHFLHGQVIALGIYLSWIFPSIYSGALHPALAVLINTPGIQMVHFFSIFLFTFTFVKACSGLSWLLSFMFRLSFHAAHINLSAYGHRCALISAGHLLLACINWVQVRSFRTRIIRSATPFW